MKIILGAQSDHALGFKKYLESKGHSVELDENSRLMFLNDINDIVLNSWNDWCHVENGAWLDQFLARK